MTLRPARRGARLIASANGRFVGLGAWGLSALLAPALGACRDLGSEPGIQDGSADLAPPLPPEDLSGTLPDEDTSGPPQWVASEAELDPRRPRLRLAMVDVGQGDGMVLFLPGGKIVALDGGPFEGRDAYRSFLNSEGASKIDAILLSHAHADHYTGLSAAMDRLPDDCSARVFDPGFQRGTDAPGYQGFRDAAGCRYRALALNMSLFFDPAVGIEVMGVASQPYPGSDGTGINNTSAVLRLYYGRFSALFTGDAQTDAERAVVTAHGDHLGATVLKVGHHGSCNATGTTFLRTVSPVYALISAATPNDFGHPHCQTIDKLRKSGAHWFRTDQNGSIRVSTDGIRYTIQPSRGARDGSDCPRNCVVPSDF